MHVWEWWYTLASRWKWICLFRSIASDRWPIAMYKRELIRKHSPQPNIKTSHSSISDTTQHDNWCLFSSSPFCSVFLYLSNADADINNRDAWKRLHPIFQNTPRRTGDTEKGSGMQFIYPKMIYSMNSWLFNYRHQKTFPESFIEISLTSKVRLLHLSSFAKLWTRYRERMMSVSSR